MRPKVSSREVGKLACRSKRNTQSSSMKETPTRSSSMLPQICSVFCWFHFLTSKSGKVSFQRTIWRTSAGKLEESLISYSLLPCCISLWQTRQNKVAVAPSRLQLKTSTFSLTWWATRTSSCWKQGDCHLYKCQAAVRLWTPSKLRKGTSSLLIWRNTIKTTRALIQILSEKKSKLRMTRLTTLCLWASLR